MARKTRVFVSFDFDRDQKLKTFILAQAKNPDSPFEIENWSLNEPAPEKSWKQKAQERIARADVVLVMVGPRSHKAPGVIAEVAIANKRLSSSFGGDPRGRLSGLSGRFAPAGGSRLPHTS